MCVTFNLQVHIIKPLLPRMKTLIAVSSHSNSGMCTLVSDSIAQSVVCLTADPGFASSNPSSAV